MEEGQADVDEDGNELHGPKNIRRRVYDALNVLMAMNIIAKDKKVRREREREGGERERERERGKRRREKGEGGAIPRKSL